MQNNSSYLLSKRDIKAFQKEILHWYTQHQRNLPWRIDRDPYHILVSEVMLQQTQVQRVIPKYENWLKAFPTLEDLAKASIRDVLLHWSGLGYNRRALYLQKFAKEIVEKFGGYIPQDEKTLRSLPGIGEYTAQALLCFAFGQQIAVVDTNVRKVILVRFGRSSLRTSLQDGEEISKKQKDRHVSLAMTKKEIEEIAQQLLPKGKAYEWNQALMDYASAMLKEHKIPIPKQSKFKDSDRFYRGLTLRVLLAEKQLSFDKLFGQINQTQKIEQIRYQKILQQLENEGLIRKKGNNFMLPEA